MRAFPLPLVSFALGVSRRRFLRTYAAVNAHLPWRALYRVVRLTQYHLSTNSGENHY